MTPSTEDVLPRVLIHLLKGLVERESAPDIWQALVSSQSHVRDYFGRIGLDLVLAESDGFAYLTQRPARDGEPELPRLIARRQLSYRVSLLLALLRKRLDEHDAASGDARLVLTAAEITDLVRLFAPDTANEVKLADRIAQDIGKVVDLGFLKPLRDRTESYEVRRILRSFVDAQWLGQMSERLAAYAAHTRARHSRARMHARQVPGSVEAFVANAGHIAGGNRLFPVAACTRAPRARGWRLRSQQAAASRTHARLRRLQFRRAVPAEALSAHGRRVARRLLQPT